MSKTDHQEEASQPSRRESKQQEMRIRIAEYGVRLFLERGFEATTMDAIAAAAGISRRTFFNYFASKEDVLLAWPGRGFPHAIGPAMRARSADGEPLDAARDCLIELVTRFETPDALAVQQLLVSTPVLKAHKQAVHARMEADMLDAMRSVWIGKIDDGALILAAMIALGALRIAQDRWRERGADRPLARYLAEAFDDLGKVLVGRQKNVDHE